MVKSLIGIKSAAGRSTFLSILAISVGLTAGRMIIMRGYQSSSTGSSGMSARMAEISNPYLETLELNPRFKERFQGVTPEKARAEAMKLSERGLKRLTTEDLLLRARILNHILENSDEKTCAAITRGGDESKPYQLKVLESLPDDMLKDWMGLTVRAVQAELNGGLYVLPTDSEVQAGFMELAESLSAKDKSALQRLASAPKQAGTSSKFVSLGPSDAEVCSAGKAVYRSLPKLSSHNQEVVSRTMVDTGD